MARDHGGQVEPRPHRITIVSRIYAPEPSAASLRLEALTREFTRRGHEVRVLTTRPPRDAVSASHGGAVIDRWPVLRDRSGYVRGYLQYMSFDVPLFLRMVFGPRADAYVIEPPPTTGAVARLASRIRRRPYVYYAADIWSDAAQMTGAAGWVIGVVRWLERFALRGADSNLVVSDGVVSRIASLAPGAKTSPVGHGVDTELFSPRGPHIADPADIVYMGTMSEWHGAGVAVEALAIVMSADPHVTAAFIGQGADRDALHAAAIAHGIGDRVRFLPPVPAEEAAMWLRSARIALATLQPGKGYDFAVPTKLYAAMAAGTPVAYSGPEPLRTLVSEDGLGTSAAHNAADYAEAISELLRRSDGEPVQHLVDWAEKHVSSVSVAGRAADAVLGVVDSRTARGRPVGGRSATER
ncbi:MAG: glycosyltransferase family 4 protein [Candidatus Microbacterium colombiense]|nr:MAG: glycosyltransferase family 4 protein [Microbacterium sp.]